MQTDVDNRVVSETGRDRRRHPRYRFSIPISIHSADGKVTPGISIEISESGISLITAAALNVNDKVELEPIAAGKVQALVRHRTGKIFGLEFLNLAPEQTLGIRESCKVLPRYRGNSLGI